MAEMTRDEVFQWLKDGAGYVRRGTNGKDGYPHVVPLGYFKGEEIVLNMHASVRRTSGVTRASPRVWTPARAWLTSRALVIRGIALHGG
ncbi:MAG: hypothetical protein H6674_01290 [Dehalococcoidia bacterium]|nr:hypothetical protein [Dehalococcoidia bacterium]